MAVNRSDIWGDGSRVVDMKYVWEALYFLVWIAAWSLVCFMLASCAGSAKYTAEPTEFGCCKVTVYNTKDIGELKTTFKNGNIDFTLEEKGVNASGPQAQQNELIKTLIPLVTK